MKKPKIYGLKRNGKLVYIGKTVKYNDDGKILNIATLQARTKFYKNSSVKIFNAEIIDETTQKKWFDDKLINIVFNKETGNLKNAKYLLQGRRGLYKEGEGYWIGKKKDKHTINKLSESKHKKILQFNQDGVLIKKWDSVKDAATKIFKDYKVINGSASSKLYDVLNKRFKTRRKFKYFWIREEDFLQYYPRIQKKISIDNLIKKELDSLPERKKTKPKYKWLYTIEEFNTNGILKKRHKTRYHAAKHYGVSPNYINRLCRQGKPNGISENIFTHGDKIKVSYNYGL